MSAGVGTRGKGGEGSKSGKKRPNRRRIPVHLTIDEQVWTLAKKKLFNVSQTVERLLRMALNEEPSVEIVRIGDLGGSVAQPGMSAALLRRVYSENGLPTKAQTENEPLQEETFLQGFEEIKKPKQPLLNSYWSKYKEEFKAYMEKQVKEGKLSERRFRDYWNGLNRFFKNHKINEAIDFLNIDHIPDSQVKGLKKFFKFLLDLKYKEVDTNEINAMNRQVKVKSSPKLQGKPAKEETMKQILNDLAKEKDYRYYLYQTLIYTGLRLSHVYKLLKEIGKGNITEKDLEVYGDVGAFDINRFSKGKKKVYYAVMPLDFAKELLANKDLFKEMPSSEKNIKFLKKVAKKQAGASNIRDWFFNKAVFELGANRTLINFIQGRADEKGAWLNYVSIKQELKSAVDEYKKLMKKGMFHFSS